jgi:hypothetical protein
MDLGTPTGIWAGRPWYEEPPRDRGHNCGECGRLLKIYHRRLSRSMTRGLIRLFVLGLRYPERQAFHVKLFDKEGARGEFGVLSCWGLVTEQPNPDGSKKTSGNWALTEFGKEFVELRQQVPLYAILKWGSELLGFSGQMVTAKECLEHGNRFKYDELMAWNPEEMF